MKQILLWLIEHSRAFLIILMIATVFSTGCHRDESTEPTSGMGLLAEFFTVNKDERLDTYLDALSQGEDPQVAKDAYYAGIAPFVAESVLSEMQDADYLYLLDKSCTDLSAKWRLSSYGMVPLSSEEEVLHYKYQVSLSYPGFVVRHHITLTGYYDLDQEQKVTAFSLDLDGLPGDISSIEDMSSSFSRQEYDAYVAEMKTQYLNTVNGGVSEGDVSYSQGYPILNCGDPYKRTYFLFIDGICKGQLTVSYVKGECASSFVYKDIPEVITLYEGNTAFNLITTGQSLYAYYEGGSTLVQGEIEQTMADQVLFQELVETHHDELQAIRLE